MTMVMKEQNLIDDKFLYSFCFGEGDTLEIYGKQDEVFRIKKEYVPLLIDGLRQLHQTGYVLPEPCSSENVLIYESEDNKEQV